MKTPLAFALIVALLTGTPLPRQSDPAEQVRIRQSGELYMAWNVSRLGELLADGNPAYDRDEISRAAQVVAAIASSGMDGLYGPGTEKSAGEMKTRVRSEFFDHPDQVKTLSSNFIAQANELARVAASAEPAVVRRQLEKTLAACQACHDRFRA